MSRSVMFVMMVLVGLTLVLPAMAQGGPPPGPPGAGAGPGGPGGPGGDRGGMMGGGMMGGMAAAPPVIAVAGDFVYVAWMGTLSQYKVSDLTLVKSVPLPMPQGMMRGGRREGARGGDAGGPPPPPPAGG